MRKRAWVAIIIVTILVLIGYKVCAYYAYVKNIEYTNTGVKIGENYTIETALLDENDYYIFHNIKVKNVFDGYTKNEDGTDTLKYVQRNENASLTKAIYIGKDSEFVDMFKNGTIEIFSTDFAIDDPKYIRKVFDKNNINNDIDLMKYFDEHYYDEPTFYNPISVQRELYLMNTLANLSLPSLDEINIIDGDYEGYILNMTANVIEINILKNDVRNYFTFIGNYEEEFIHDFMNTVVIE